MCSPRLRLAGSLNDKRMGETAENQVTVNFVALLALPAAVVTLILPVFAPEGTLTFILVAESEVIVATTPPIVTFVAPDRFVPVMVTTLPGAPEAGENLVMVGKTAVTSKHSSTVESELPE